MAYATGISDKEIRQLLSSIADELNSDEQEQLKFLSRDVLKEKDKIETPLNLFDILLKSKTICPENMASLVEALNLMQRRDAIEKIQNFYSGKNIKNIPRSESYISPFTSQLYKLGCDMDEKDVQNLAFQHKKANKYKNRWELLTLLCKESVLNDMASIDKTRKLLKLAPDKNSERLHYPQEYSSPGQNVMAFPDVPDSSLFPDNSLSQSMANDSRSQSSEEPVAGDKNGQHDITAKKMSITQMNQYFKEDNKLCSGGGGTVYKGCKQYNDCDVVVKILHNDLDKKKMLESFTMEMISSRKKHPFLLPLLAYCEENQEENGQYILMYPYMMNEDLDTRLKHVWDKKALLLLDDCIRIVYQVSVGLKFLHQDDGNNRIEIIHRDVKASNILLDDMLNARLSDPGIARELGGQTHVTITSSMGTPGYVDPDVISSGEFRPINDVFGLGVVMLQLLLNKPAQIEVEEKGKTKNKNLFQMCRKRPEKDILKEAKEHHKDWPEELLKKFVNLAWQAIAVADDRITLDILSEQLHELLISASAELWKCPSQLTMCVSCFGQPIVKLKPLSPNCKENCARFCLNCLSRSQENPLFCPQHGECQPPIGHNNIFVLMVSGIGKNPKEKIILNSDIDRMKEILEDKHIIGVSPDNITVICENDDKNSILIAVDEIKEKVEGRFESLFIFYYTGHHNMEREFLTDEQKKYHLKEEELKDHFRQLNATYMLFILDTCYSGGADIGAKGDYQDYSPPCLWDVFESDLQAKGEKSVCVVQWSSSAKSQESYYEGNQSAFTSAIISQLKNECVISCKDCSSCNGFRKSAKQKSYIDLKELHDCVEYHVRKIKSEKQLPELHQKPEDAFIPPFAYYVHKDM